MARAKINPVPRKHKIIWSLLIVFIAAALIILIGREDATVAAVNGERISAGEFNLILVNKANKEVVTAFSAKSVDVGDKNFWGNSYDGQIPKVLAKEQALDELVRIKLQQLLALKYGVFDDISYNTFLKNFKKENQRRREALKNNEVIYGPEQYDEYGYYNHVLSNMITAVKSRFWEVEYGGRVSDDELRLLYEKTKDQFYTKPITIKTERIFIDLSIVQTDKERENAASLMNEIKAGADRGESFENVLKTLGSEFSPVYLKQVLDPSYYRAEGKGGGCIYRQSSSLAVGETSEVFESNGAEAIDQQIIARRTLNIVRCLEKDGTGYQSFEEARQAVTSRFIDARYNEMLDRLASEAEVVIY